jgi:hypothetical protein
MISKEQLQSLRERATNHEVENDVAIVKLTAKELTDLLNEIELLQLGTNDL